MNFVEDPSNFSEAHTKRIVYAAPQLNFTQSKDLQDHCVFDKPDSHYETCTIDLSEIITTFDYSDDWPFRKKDTPINGIFCMPEGKGSFPLAIIIHGNSNYKFNSAPGFLYLCDVLAHHGVVAATIDASFISNRNQITIGLNDKVLGRAILLLEHIKQFRHWNKKKGHPLYKRIDLQKCMIIGHSFGGEAVGHASILNIQDDPVQFFKGEPSVDLSGKSGELGPYKFGISAVVALAPSDQTYRFPKIETRIPSNYLVIQGSRDISVSAASVNLTYDRSHPVLSNIEVPRAIKSLLWIHKANHNYFNSVWEPEIFNNVEFISPEHQRRIATVYISAFARTFLLGKRYCLRLLQDYRFGMDKYNLPRDVTCISQYQSSHRLLLQHFEEDGIQPIISAPNKGRVFADNISIHVQPFFRLIRHENSRGKVSIRKDPSYHLFQENYGLRIDWVNFGGKYVLEFENHLNVKDFNALSFRAGQSDEMNNFIDQDQDFFTKRS